MLLFCLRPVCPVGTFGTNCVSSCACNTTNTVSCNNINGFCTCNLFWQGADCNTDIDECNPSGSALNPCVLTSYSTCMNMPGSFECQCNTGYEKHGDVCEGESLTVPLLNIIT